MTENILTEYSEQINQINNISYKIQNNTGISGIADAIGVRQTGLKNALA